VNSLIQITTNEQGSSVVSARELYTFLGFDASQWSRWSKKNIVSNPFAEDGRDYTPLDMMSSNSTDYALTLDFAKRVAMLARTEKGEQIRQYFIECERKLTTPPALAPAPVSTEQLLIQLVAGQQVILEQLRADVESIKQAGQHTSPARSALRRTPTLPGLTLPPPNYKTLRHQINRSVNLYAEQWQVSNSETYAYLYERLYSRFGINPYKLKQGRENILDALERHGHLDRLYSLIRAELAYTEE